MENSNYVKLAAIDVKDHIEKKAGLSYLSWPWAVDTLMRHDPSANWEFHEPVMFGKTMMVYCSVTAFGKTIKMHLPVMDHRNKAIENPGAFEINKNMMRCLVKAIACHGLGLYIYAGEDLPTVEEQPQECDPLVIALFKECKTMDDLKQLWSGLENKVLYTEHKDAAKIRIQGE